MWPGMLSRPYERWSGDCEVDLVGMLCQAALCLSVPLRANREKLQSPLAPLPTPICRSLEIVLQIGKGDAEVWD